MNLTGISSIRIPEGSVRSITVGGRIIWQKNTIPAEYTALAYIESTRKQYIDTGIMAKDNTRVVLDFSLDELPDDTNSKYIFGARTALNKNSFALMCQYRTKRYRTHYANEYLDSELDALGRHLIDMNGNTCVIDSEELEFRTGSFSSGCPMYLGTLNTKGKPFANGLIGKIYACQIYDNGILVRDFIPCRRDSDGEVGMYDRVTETFFGNAGTGEFVAGEKENAS